MGTERNPEIALYFRTYIEPLPACPFPVHIHEGYTETFDNGKVHRHILVKLPVKEKSDGEYQRAKDYLFRFFPDYKMRDHGWSVDHTEERWDNPQRMMRFLE